MMNIYDTDPPVVDDDNQISSSYTNLNAEIQIEALPSSTVPATFIPRRRHRRRGRHRGRTNVARHTDSPPANRAASATTRQALAVAVDPSFTNTQLANRVALLAEMSAQRRYVRRGGEVMSKPPQDKKHTKWLYGGGRIGTSNQRPKVRVA